MHECDVLSYIYVFDIGKCVPTYLQFMNKLLTIICDYLSKFLLKLQKMNNS